MAAPRPDQHETPDSPSENQMLRNRRSDTQQVEIDSPRPTPTEDSDPPSPQDTSQDMLPGLGSHLDAPLSLGQNTSNTGYKLVSGVPKTARQGESVPRTLPESVKKNAHLPPIVGIKRVGTDSLYNEIQRQRTAPHAAQAAEQGKAKKAEGDVATPGAHHDDPKEGPEAPARGQEEASEGETRKGA